MYCALDEEGLVWHSTSEYSKRVSPTAINEALSVYCWSKCQKEAILTSFNGEVPATNIEVTGNPRYDILSPKYIPFHRFNLDQLRTDSRQFILINSSFTAGNWNPDLYQTGTYLEHQKNRGKIKSLESLQFYTEKELYTKKVFAEYVKLVELLSSCFTDLDIIVRPHPDENHTNWKNLTTHLPNVIVTADGSMTYWASKAISVVYTGCTTGIEAYVLGSNIINFSPFHDYRFEPQLPNSLVTPLSSPQEVLRRISTNLSHKPSQQNITLPQHLKDLMPPIKQNKSSCELIAESIYKHSLDISHASPSHYRLISEPLRILMFSLSSYLRDIKNSILIPSKTKRSRLNKYSKVRLKDIEQKLSLLSTSTSGEQTSYRLKQLSSSTFVISNSH